jgi:SAM-dependent methyltransferase
LVAAERFVKAISDVDRRLRKAQATLPSREVKNEVCSAFWAFVGEMNACEAEGAVTAETPVACREIVGPWLFRSRHWSRAYHKPHGYPGDYRMVECMYDLETDPCADPGQPGIVNCLDHLLTTVHSVVSVWQRRAWFARLLEQEHARRGGTLRVLDIAAGGARYVRDFLARANTTSGVQVTLVDQDPAALAFLRGQSLAAWSGELRTLCAPIRQMAALVAGEEFDVIISAGLFDYLDDVTASALIADFTSLLAPGGVVAISNFHPDDPSHLVKAWLVDWPLIFRTESQCAALFPQRIEVHTDRSENRALSYARAQDLS